MELKTYVVTYYPYATSDMKATAYWTGKDEDDCAKSWERQHPLWSIVSLKEKVDA